MRLGAFGFATPTSLFCYILAMINDSNRHRLRFGFLGGGLFVEATMTVAVADVF